MTTASSTQETWEPDEDLFHATELLDGSTGKWYFRIQPGSVIVDRDNRTVTFTVRWNHSGARRRITLGIEQIRGIRVDLPA